MKNLILTLLFFLIFTNVNLFSYEENQDSIIVKTFTFDSISTRRGVFEFPPAAQYEKVIMHYTLKCDPRTTRDKYDCGEWDYLTYTTLRDTLGRFDSTKNIQYKYVLKNTSPDIIYEGVNPAYKIIKYGTLNHFINNLKVDTSYTTGYTKGINSALSNGKYILKFDLTDAGLTKLDAIKLPIDKSLNSSGILKDFTVYLARIVGDSIDNSTKQLLFRDDLDFSQLDSFLILPIYNFSLTNKKIALILSAADGKEFYFNTIPSNKDKIVAFIQENKSAEFSGQDYVEIPKSALTSIKDEVTICFWAKGAQSLPYDTQILEAVNSKNQRVLNIHLPWSNKRIYWDAGNNGSSYDRIDFEASDNMFKKEWSHWAFVKNAKTGEMKIYRNGKIIHSGTDKKLSFDEIEVFRIASGASSNGRWTGNIDDFAIWDRELSASEINEFSLGVTLNVNDMLVFYKFDNYVNDNEVPDESSHNISATAIGLPNLIKTRPEDYFRVFQELGATVSIEFVEGTITSAVAYNKKEFKTDLAKKSVFVYDYQSLDSIVPAYLFNGVSKKLRTPTDTLFINDIYNYVTEENSIDVDTIFAEKTKLYDNSQIVWYNPSVEYEIDRFITPYGIGLDLGDDGFTWKVDVSEFAPLLNGFVDLSAGNDQELLDLKFIFIKGKPARNINSIRRIWGSGGNYSDVVVNKAIAPVTLNLDENSSYYRVITRSSGHGFGGDVNVTDNCSEFCAREHSLWVNGKKEFFWTGWKECGDNPVYPQGGTWILDRTDWCPGAPVNTYRHELDPALKNTSVTFDYEIENPAQYSPNGNWVFTSYLVEYGDFNFVSDAGIVEILSPSNHDEFLRFNPICNNARVLIANNGSSEITSLEVKWKIDNKFEGTYTWEGSIPKLASKEISIPLNFEAFENIAYTNRKFEVEILNVNGKADEYSHNNFGKSDFNEVDNLYKNTQIVLRTSDWSVYNMKPPLAYQFNDLTKNVNVIKKESFENNTNYVDSLNLDNGCYEYMIEAADGYGLSYWALRDVKAGALQIKSGSSFAENVRTEFGNFYYKQFKVANKPQLLGADEDVNFGNVEEGSSSTQTLILEAKNDLGINVISAEIKKTLIDEFSIDSFEPNVSLPYFIKNGEQLKVNLKYTQKRTGIRKGTLMLKSNDGEEPNRLVNLVAYVGVNSVEKSKFDEISIFENPIKDKAVLKVNTFEPNELVKISLFNLMGNKIKTFYEGYLQSNQNEFELDFRDFARGKYYIVVSSENDIKSVGIILE